jgi:acyl-CoA thioesterase I
VWGTEHPPATIFDVNPLALYFASGESLYPGAALLILACFVPRRLSLARSVTSWLGLCLMVVACPPMSWFTYAVLGLLFLLWLFIGKHARWVARAATVSLIALVLLIAGTEYSHRKLPLITGARDNHLVIVGDSLSSGLGEARSWPAIFEESTGVGAKNLARPGAGVEQAQAMAAQISSDDHVVLLEIGGNDLLAGLPSDKFADGLEELLIKVCSPQRTVVMFELPLIPSKIGYGQVQRRLSAKYHVSLIPKRFLADVLGSDTTSDGLHLSQRGASRLAAFVASALAQVLPTSKPR